MFSNISGSQWRLYGSVTNVRKNGTVNKSNSKVKKIVERDESPLSIYPLSINEFKKAQSKAKSTNKTEKTTPTKIEKPSVLPPEMVSSSETVSASVLNVPENVTQIEKPANVEEKKPTEAIVKPILRALFTLFHNIFVFIISVECIR